MKFKEVVNNLNILKLDKMASCLSEYVDKVNNEKIPFLDALLELTKLEIANKTFLLFVKMGHHNSSHIFRLIFFPIH